MKKAVIIAALLSISFLGCRDRKFQTYGSLYNPVSYSYANTGGVVSTYPYDGTYSATPIIGGSGHSCYSRQTYYSPYYSYRYPNYYYSYPNYSYRPCGCLDGSESRFNFSVTTAEDSELREVNEGILRAETFGTQTEVEYGIGDEKLNLLHDKKGNTWISGKIKIAGELTRIDTKNQKCKSTRNKFEEDPAYEVARFDCSVNKNKITIQAEALIPVSQQLN